MKFTAIAAVVLLAAATFVVPVPSMPSPGAVPSSPPPPYAVCPLLETARRTSGVELLTDTGAELTTAIFSAGEVLVETGLALEPGARVVEIADLTGAARAPMLLDRGHDQVVAGSWLEGRGVAASRCDPGSAGQVVVAGGSTREGDTHTILLANPFGAVAVVDVTATSEVGVETESTLEGIVVPPRSLVSVELTRLLAGRQFLSAIVTPVQGRVITGAVHEGEGDVSATAGLEPSTDWWLPVPDIGVETYLVLVAPGSADTPFQLDVSDTEGELEAAHEDIIGARGQYVLGVDELMVGAGAIRVTAASPVVAVLWTIGEGIRSVVPGVPAASEEWWLPAARGPVQIMVFNPGTVDVTATAVNGSAARVTREVPASSLEIIELGGGDLRLTADGEVVVTWFSLGEQGMAGEAGWAR